VSVELPRGTGPLTATALAQLICTAADARLLEAPDTSTASTKVTVTVPGAWRTEGSSETCPGTPAIGASQVPQEPQRAGPAGPADLPDAHRQQTLANREFAERRLATVPG
jgi:hypothetical protein